MSDKQAAMSCAKSNLCGLPADLDYIPEELRIRAQSELSEDENTRVQSLMRLRSMLEKEKDLRWKDDDLFLLAFLRARKFDVKKAFHLMQGLYNCFGKHTHIYYNFSMDHIKTIIKENSHYILPYRDNEGSIVVCFRYISWDPDVISAEEHLVSLTLGLLQALQSPSTQIAGFQFIMNFEGFSSKHLRQGTPSVLGFIADIFQNAMPIRVKGMHMVNQPIAFYYLWNILKHLLSKKIQERMHVHGRDLKSLHKFFHPSILPADLGGELPPFNNADWCQRMEKSADYIQHVLTFGYEKNFKKEQRRKSSVASIKSRRFSATLLH